MSAIRNERMLCYRVNSGMLTVQDLSSRLLDYIPILNPDFTTSISDPAPRVVREVVSKNQRPLQEPHVYLSLLACLKCVVTVALAAPPTYLDIDLTIECQWAASERAPVSARRRDSRMAAPLSATATSRLHIPLRTL